MDIPRDDPSPIEPKEEKERTREPSQLDKGWSNAMRGMGIKFAAILCLVTSAAGASTNDARREGFALYETGRYAEAVARLDPVLDRHPNDVEALIKRGGCHLRLGRPSKALGDFDRIIHRDPMNPSGHANRGIALVMLGRYDEAEAAFTRAIRLWAVPLNGARSVGGGRDAIAEAKATAYAGLAQVHHRTGRNEEALAEYDQAILINANDPNSHIGRGDVYRALGDLARALADFDEAIRLGPALPRAYTSRGRLLEDNGEDGRALADYDRAIALDPRYAFAHSLRGGLLSRLGRNEEALAAFETVGQLLPENAEAHKDRGGVLVRMGRDEEALVELNKAIEINPTLGKAYQNRGAAYNNLARYDEAIADLNRAIEIDPTNAGARTNCGLAYFMVGEYERALEDLSEAVRLAPREAIVHFNRGNVYAKLGLKEQALADYRTVGELNPKLVATYGGPQRLFEEMSRDAMAARDRAPMRVTSSDVETHLSRAREKQGVGDWPGAVAELDQAITAAPRRADLYIARGWSRLCADVDGAEIDARAYLNLKGWGDPAAGYMALLGALASRRAGREPDAYAMLEEALAKLPRQDAWPKPILLFLNGDLSGEALIEQAGNDIQRGEAHAILALDLLRKKKPKEAREHLLWVRDHSTARSIAADLARATLARLDRPNQIARKP